MNQQDFELIALEHVLTRYRLTGELPSINGQPFNINEFKSQLFAGTSYQGTDVNINIDTVKMENTVVDCDNDEEQKTEPAADNTIAVEDPNAEASVVEPAISTVDTEQKPESTAPSIGGKLFQFFAKDKGNEPQ